MGRTRATDEGRSEVSGKPLKIPRYLCHLSGPTISGFYNISLSLLSFLPPFPVPVPVRVRASVRRALCFSRSKWPYTAYQSPTLLTIAHLRQGDRREEASLPFSPRFPSRLYHYERMDGWMDGFCFDSYCPDSLALDWRGRGRSLSPPLPLHFSGRASECTLATVILELLRRFISPLVSPSLANPLGGRRESGQTSWLFVTLMPQSAIRISGAVITTSTSQAKGII